MFSEEKTLQDILLQGGDKLLVDPSNKIEQLLSVNGDGTGETEMVNATPKGYFIAAPAGEIYVINRMNVYIEVGMNDKFDAAKYGATTALTNGIILTVQNAFGNLKTMTPHTIKKIGHWNLGAGIDAFYTDFPAGSSDMAAVRWTFTKGNGPIFLIGDNGEKLVLDVLDDLGAGGAALVSHIVQVEGLKFRPPSWWKLNL